MKVLFLGAALATAFGQLASATPELKLVSGASTLVIGGVGSTVTYFNTDFNGWNISIVFGSSNSPNLLGASGNFGIDDAVLAACIGGTCASNPLDILMSDTGFTQGVDAGGFTSIYSPTEVGGTTTQLAWDSTDNTMFGAGTLIGTLGPFTGSGNGSVSGGGPAGPSAYALTVEDIYDGSGGSASFSTDGHITGTPEPNAMVLCGIGLAFLAAASLWRKLLGLRSRP
jgi:hypothetical protein